MTSQTDNHMDKKYKRKDDDIINISNSEKKIFKKFTKREYVEYYKKIANIMLHSIRKRPIVMYRFPNGADKEGFYQKNKPNSFPSWIEHIKIKKKEGEVDYIICNNKECLIYVASQVGEIHTWTSTTENLGYPDKMVFDIDPSEKNSVLLKNTVLKLKQLLTDIGLNPYLLATGKKGYHIIVPIKPKNSNDKVREFALKIAKVIEQDNPKNITTELSKNKRINKIFIDINRNSPQQTSISPYSVRATLTATVALPIFWEELRKTNPDSFDINDVLKRMQTKSDPLKYFYKNSKSLNKIMKKLKKDINKETKKGES
ncbi:MAG: non-homologous end-joining DNA ligase [Candidatus Woesearchaeota archaeon]|jgi:bifunctional non-homologous end joining protein LigD